MKGTGKIDEGIVIPIEENLSSSADKNNYVNKVTYNIMRDFIDRWNEIKNKYTPEQIRQKIIESKEQMVFNWITTREQGINEINEDIEDIINEIEDKIRVSCNKRNIDISDLLP